MLCSDWQKTPLDPRPRPKARALVPQREPAYVRVVAMFLRHDVGDILIRDSTFVQINKSCAVPIAVVFERTASEPS